MTTNQMLYVKFFTRTTKKDPELGMLYLRITYNAKRVDLSFNHKVKMRAWDSDKELVKSADKNYHKLNQAINSARTKIFSI
ncbi:Arm DNA-binding domain-containing protein [Plebeiibacterium marinum]|uniref:Arm DNA-binding domain-containing protein n=1 Tax=Plebeiibacterium marinum TaxID=2992111 RepID=A0AAE3SKD6_9BACT|nr:Arm DNA-binding domain-containing protein [Plebeiobacterium marinum]MCW3806720.1 Arm DNA-binding domain-containing protein [Plebeiobacterium marinum]